MALHPVNVWVVEIRVLWLCDFLRGANQAR